MNTCPVYRRSGGYSYTYFIPGPIGVNLGMLHDPQKHSENVGACSLCLSCDNVCAAEVAPGHLNPWGVGHSNPEFAKKSFRSLWREGLK